MSNSFIWPTDRSLLPATHQGQSHSWSDFNDGLLHISPSTSNTGASLSDCLVSFPGHSLGEVLSLCEDAVGIFYISSRLGPKFGTSFRAFIIELIMWDRYESAQSLFSYWLIIVRQTDFNIVGMATGLGEFKPFTLFEKLHNLPFCSCEMVSKNICILIAGGRKVEWIFIKGY